MAKRTQNSPFGALAKLCDQLPAGHPKPAAPRIKPDTVETTAKDDDTTLFLAALGDVTRMEGNGRAEIERARPAPIPRARTPDEVLPEEAPRRRPVDVNDPDALFREAMSGVQRLADSGRAEVGQRPRSAHRLHASTTNPPQPEAPYIPENIDDPATLFRRVVGDAAPLPESNRIEPQRPLPPPRPRKREEDDAAVLRESIEAPLSFEDRIDTGDEGVHLREGLPRRILTDLRRGRWVVQAELDLHGLTRDAARSALGHFLHESLENGFRCVRLIHGKGLGSPGREPVLKHLSRGWLMQREEILAFCQARPHDGGEGALLVLLRNANKKG